LKKVILFIAILAISLSADWDELLVQKKDELKSNHIISYVKKIKKTYTGYTILDVKGNIDDVFEDIINFDKYPDRISKVDKAKIYEVNNNIVKVQLTFAGFLLTLNNYFEHKIDKQKHIMTWHIDKDKKSQLLDISNGKWKLQKISKNKIRVFYKNEILVKSWIPNILVNYMLKSSAIDATKWLIEK
jgi:ribosome-associated toxin RatA of RatAB toxin-antitoxin module